jgi:hypothetical protein
VILTRDTIVIAGERFPLCSLVCPQAPGQDEDEWNRSLGCDSKYARDGYVPVENGLLVMVEQSKQDGLLTCGTFARTCELRAFPTGDVDEELWLPWWMHVDGKTLTASSHPGRSKCPWEWTNCEPWWLAEHILRLSTLPYVEPPGPQVQMKSWMGEEPWPPIA